MHITFKALTLGSTPNDTNFLLKKLQHIVRTMKKLNTFQKQKDVLYEKILAYRKDCEKASAAFKSKKKYYV